MVKYTCNHSPPAPSPKNSMSMSLTCVRTMSLDTELKAGRRKNNRFYGTPPAVSFVPTVVLRDLLRP